MKLSDLQSVVSLDLKRDSSFQSLGLLSHDALQMLVMFYDADYLDHLVNNPHIACVVTKPGFVDRLPARLGVAACSDPLATFYGIHDHLLAETDFYGKSFDSEVSPEAVVHETAYVAPRSVRIGRGTRVGPRAVILERTTIGENVVVGPGAIIGAEGFEPKHINGRHILVRHAGGVSVHNGVNILANSHVAKAVFNGSTEIGEDTKIDALVHIAHNARIGRHCEIAAGALVAGSSTVGDEVWIGPHAVISSEIHVGDRAFVAIGAVVVKDVPGGQRVAGMPARSMFPRLTPSAEKDAPGTIREN